MYDGFINYVLLGIFSILSIFISFLYNKKTSINFFCSNVIY